MAIDGILFIALAVVAAGVSGFTACIGFLIGDPVIYNRLTMSYWYDTLIGAIMSVGPREVAVSAAFAAVVCVWIGLTMLV